MRPATWRGVCAFLATLLLGACAARVPVAPAQLAPLAAPVPDVVLDADVAVQLTTQYTRTIPSRVRWRAVGRLAQGTVYRPVDSVFAIEGRDVHEAYLVLRGAALQGFFLPGEGNYSALPSAIQLPVNTGEHR